MENQENGTDQTRIIDPAKVLLPLGLGTALSLMGDAAMYTVLPTHTADAGIKLAAVGIILSANRIIRLFLNTPAGHAYDRFPRRKLFIPALFIGALSTAIYAATKGFWPLLAGRLIWGLAWSGIWVGGATIILDVTTDRDRGRWTGLYQTWFFLGTAIGAFLGGWLTDLVGYSATMWIGAAITTLGAIAALIKLPETRAIRDQPIPISDPGTLNKWRPGGELLGVVSLNGINRFILAGVLSATLALLVNDHLNTNNIVIGVATITGILLGLRTIFSMFAAPFAGTLSDRFGNRWGVTIVGLLLGALGMVLLVHGEPAIIIIGIGFTAIAGGSVQALVTTRTGDLADLSERGKAIGLLHTVGDFGSALGPVIAYALLSWITINELYQLSAVIFVIGAGLATLMYFQQKRASP